MLTKILKNAGFLIIASVVEKISYVFLFAIIARELTKIEFGTYNLVLTLIFIGGMIVNFGMEGVIVREVAKDRNKAPTLFVNALLLTIFFSLISWPMTVGLAYFLKFGPHVVFLMGFAGCVFLFMGIGQVAGSVIKGYERMDLFAGVSVCMSLVGLGLNVFVLWIGGKVQWLVGALLLTEGLRAIVLTFIVHYRLAVLRWRPSRTTVVEILKCSVPFALLMGYVVVFHRTDLLIMGWLKPLDDVAVYGVASKFADFLTLLSGSLIGALYPVLSAKIASSREELWGLYNDYIGVFAIVGFGASLAVMVLAQPIIIFLFGGKYLIGAGALKWLACGFLFSALSGPVGILLLAVGDQMNRLLVLGLLVLSFNVGCNIWLVSLYSYDGAAIATFLSAVVGFAGRLIMSRTYFGRFPNFLRLTWRPLSASVLMAVVLHFFIESHIVLSIAIGTVVYFTGLSLCGEFRKARYAPVRTKVQQFISRFSA